MFELLSNCYQSVFIDCNNLKILDKKYKRGLRVSSSTPLKIKSRNLNGLRLFFFIGKNKVHAGGTNFFSFSNYVSKSRGLFKKGL